MGALWKGAARRLDDIDLPKLGATIGVGEDEIHAVLDVESRGGGFDRQGRVLMLFEPHKFWRHLGPGEKRDAAVARGLAWQSWRPNSYPPDSYPRLIDAMAIDETAALKSASWGLGQIMGENHRAAGYESVQAMVAAFADDEESHLAAMIAFIKAARLDDELRRHDWRGFARGYNGESYERNNYHTRLERAFARWSRINDTPWSPIAAVEETRLNDPHAPHVTAPPAPAPVAKPAPTPAAPPAQADTRGFWRRFFDALLRRTA